MQTQGWNKWLCSTSVKPELIWRASPSRHNSVDLSAEPVQRKDGHALMA